MRVAVPGNVTYSRLFPAIERSFDYKVLEKLGLSMRGDKTRMPYLPAPPPPPAAAYTYFGQFIAHDLTRDDTELFPHPIPEPEDVVNHRTPFLDLHSVYGHGPLSGHAFLYELDGFHLKIGAKPTGYQSFDVPLDFCGRPLLADNRNNENIVIRQIHAIFLRLHNLAVDELQGTVPDVDLFETARQRVCWQYQWLVRYDYLPRVCKPEIYDDIVRRGNTLIDWGNCFAIPVEFSHAAARFGHSMVRDKYNLNGSHLELPVATLFAEAHQKRALGLDLAVEWTRFARDPAMSIDTTVVAALFDLSEGSINPFVKRLTPEESNALPVRTLQRGIAMKIPTGETVCQALDSSANLCHPPEYNPFRDLSDLGLIGRTPLWYYVLLEAEVCEKGTQLGAIGSRLIAEVIEGSLRHDPGSIENELAADPTWRPPRWNAAATHDIEQFVQLTALLGLS